MIEILLLLKNNWKAIAVVLLLASIYGIGRYQGVHAERIMCEATLQQARDEKQAEKDRLQYEADAKSKAYEDLKAQTEKTITDVKRRLSNAIQSNHAFASCHAGPDFLHLYAETAGTRSTGATSR